MGPRDKLPGTQSPSGGTRGTIVVKQSSKFGNGTVVDKLSMAFLSSSPPFQEQWALLRSSQRGLSSWFRTQTVGFRSQVLYSAFLVPSTFATGVLEPTTVNPILQNPCVKALLFGYLDTCIKPFGNQASRKPSARPA